MIPLPGTDSPLDHATARAAFGAMLDGDVTDAEATRFLTGLTVREETAIEIAAAAQALRDRMIPVTAPADAIDVCGTGGDGSHSLNVSTAVAIVVAACGVPVAKHGNRAASSSAGAADTLEALGLNLDRASAIAEDTLNTLGIAFLFAQTHHPALARLAPVRRAIGRRTIFNLIGPIAKPARVRRQLIGVASAMMVAGDEPLDELSVCAPSTAIRIGACGDRTERLTPADAGLSTHAPGELLGGTPAFNAAALTALLAGAPGAYRDAVLLNTAGALIVAEHAADWTAGVALAVDAIDSGCAATLLSRWIAA